MKKALSVLTAVLISSQAIAADLSGWTTETNRPKRNFDTLCLAQEQGMFSETYKATFVPLGEIQPSDKCRSAKIAVDMKNRIIYPILKSDQLRLSNSNAGEVLNQVRNNALEMISARYKSDYEGAQTTEEMKDFIENYANNDPDNLVPKMKERLAALQQEIWQENYEDDFAASNTIEDLKRFIEKYSNRDPDNLVSQAKERIAQLMKEASLTKQDNERYSGANNQNYSGKLIGYRNNGKMITFLFDEPCELDKLERDETLRLAKATFWTISGNYNWDAAIKGCQFSDITNCSVMYTEGFAPSPVGGCWVMTKDPKGIGVCNEDVMRGFSCKAFPRTSFAGEKGKAPNWPKWPSNGHNANIEAGKTRASGETSNNINNQFVLSKIAQDVGLLAVSSKADFIEEAQKRGYKTECTIESSGGERCEIYDLSPCPMTGVKKCSLVSIEFNSSGKITSYGGAFSYDVKNNAVSNRYTEKLTRLFGKPINDGKINKEMRTIFTQNSWRVKGITVEAADIYKVRTDESIDASFVLTVRDSG